ncbi:MAG: helix-turn-helix domain-containing protein [Candidatus Omnitrophica bacterium]|nr:helix-turn-helix domain-containing protein [Candidatus Omnitrophota bacterium]
MIDLRKYLTVEEVAKRLDVTEDWIRDLIQTKKLRAIKVKKWRINPKDLEEFIKKRTNK